MTANPDDEAAVLATTVTLRGDDWEVSGRVTVPAGPIQLVDILPLARALSDAVVGETVRALDAAGTPVSCRMGCGACCRQLVLISEVEARQIRRVVDDLPEPRRTEVRARFAAARRRLDAAGLTRRLEEAESWDDESYLSLASDYFRQGIPCPFLEHESCSIYPERPITCREFLVVSPAENCSNPTPETVQRVKLPMKVFNAVARMQVSPSTHFLERFVPLIFAPGWAESHPDDPPPQPGPELLRELLGHLSGEPAGPGPDTEGR